MLSMKVAFLLSLLLTSGLETVDARRLKKLQKSKQRPGLANTKEADWLPSLLVAPLLAPALTIGAGRNVAPVTHMQHAHPATIQMMDIARVGQPLNLLKAGYSDDPNARLAGPQMTLDDAQGDAINTQEQARDKLGKFEADAQNVGGSWDKLQELAGFESGAGGVAFIYAWVATLGLGAIVGPSPVVDMVTWYANLFQHMAALLQSAPTQCSIVAVAFIAYAGAGTSLCNAWTRIQNGEEVAKVIRETIEEISQEPEGKNILYEINRGFGHIGSEVTDWLGQKYH